MHDVGLFLLHLARSGRGEKTAEIDDPSCTSELTIQPIITIPTSNLAKGNYVISKCNFVKSAKVKLASKYNKVLYWVGR